MTTNNNWQNSSFKNNNKPRSLSNFLSLQYFFPSTTSDITQPTRRLNWVDGVSILVGIIIGSGIFSSPGLALERAGSPGAVLIAWICSGLLVILCAHCYIELGSMMPNAGGDFEYLKRAYGERVAFSFAWFNFFVSKTGAQAIIATVFGIYFQTVITGDTSSVLNGTDVDTAASKISAVCLICIITIINCFGIKESAILQRFLTISKIVLVLLVFTFSLAFASNNSEVVQQNLSPSTAFEGSNGIINFGSAMVACLWCFDGFADANFLQEELMDPTGSLQLIIRMGLVIVTFCYVLINIAYLTVLSKDSIIDSNGIAVQFGTSASDQLFTHGKNVLPILLAAGVALSTAGGINGSIMTGGRAFFAVARSGKAPAFMTQLNFAGAPWAALLAQGSWSIVLLMLPGSSFSTLLDYFGPASWMYYALSASALIRLRYIEKVTPRPFLVPLYPLPPILVILVAVMILVSSLAVEPLFTVLALGFISLSFPVHMMMEYIESRRSKEVIVDVDGFQNNALLSNLYDHQPLVTESVYNETFQHDHDYVENTE